MKKRWWILFLILFLVYLAVVIIGTLAVQGRSLLEWVHLLVPSGKIRNILVYPLQHHHPVTFAKLLNFADRMGNFLLFFPLGIGVFFVFRRISPGSVRTPLIVALFLGLFLSIGIETFQYLVPKRIPSLSDIIANTAGAVFGCYILPFREMSREIKTREQGKTKIQ